jgi:hypothetical protein
MFPINATAIDDTHLMLVGVDCPADGEVAEAMAFIYDTSTRPPTITEVEPPPIPVQGASFGAVGGKVVLFGGRVATQSNGVWSVPVTGAPADINGEPVESSAYIYDPATNRWQAIPNSPPGRVGAAVVEREGKLYFIGGEETTTTGEASHRVRISQASSRVDVYDVATGKWERGPDLESPIVFGSAYTDDLGRIVVAGGFDIIRRGREWLAKATMMRLDPTAPDPRWKTVGDLPGMPAGAPIAVVGHPDGLIMGPLWDNQGLAGFHILRRPRKV